MSTSVQLKQYLQELSHRQDQLAQQSYQAALAKLNRAERETGERETLLKAAAKDLMLAIRKNRHSADPYAGMAYLQLLRRDPERTLNFLESALRLDPQHEMALALKQRLQPPQTDAPVAERAQSSEQYEAVEQQIQAQLAQLTSADFAVQPSTDDAVILRLASRYDDLEQSHAQLQAQIRQLEKPHETQPLHQQLSRLETALAAYQKVLAICEQFLVLQKEIEQSISQAMEMVHFLGKIPSGQTVPTAFFADLETLYDACDAYADQLEAVENQRLQIDSVSGRYEKLALLVQVLQEHLDELG